ncbi:energy-coupling factor ABC transporter ATP-binding protein [uncultured Anaerococcus sp.]|uniref:energy-coupling factor ABC transporter ATP-binding protein n=1 Tax=Anaerococcus sp. AH8042_DFU013_CI05 TaxID=3385202 RepID=UPI00345DA029
MTNNNEEIIRFEDIALAYDSIKGDPKIIFESLNLSIKRGDKIALIGSNGAGKSTLMKLLVGLVKTRVGKISFNNKNINEIDEEEIARYISLVYQNPEEMFIQDSIYEDIAFAMKEREIADYEEKTSDLIDRFRLSDLKDRDGRLLSGGQMRRASVAIGIALKPQVLLLDEPTANLDMATRTEIIKVLEDIKAETETVIIATHDMQLVSQWADRVIVLHDGQVIADESKDKIFDNDYVKNTISIRAPEIFDLAQGINPNTYVYTVEDFLNNIDESTGMSI